MSYPGRNTGIVPLLQVLQTTTSEIVASWQHADRGHKGFSISNQNQVQTMGTKNTTELLARHTQDTDTDTDIVQRCMRASQYHYQNGQNLRRERTLINKGVAL